MGGHNLAKERGRAGRRRRPGLPVADVVPEDRDA
jgi:hypothetical protein